MRAQEKETITELEHLSDSVIIKLLPLLLWFSVPHNWMWHG